MRKLMEMRAQEPMPNQNSSQNQSAPSPSDDNLEVADVEARQKATPNQLHDPTYPQPAADDAIVNASKRRSKSRVVVL
jgi:hypothetical protein